MSYSAKILISEQFQDKIGEKKEFDVEILFGDFQTEEEAEKEGSSAKVIIEGGGIVIRTGSDTVYQIDKNYSKVKFLQIKKEKREQMGESIDSSVPENIMKIIETLEDESSLYMIGPEDMEKVDYLLKDFIDSFPNGYVLQNISYGTIYNPD